MTIKLIWSKADCIVAFMGVSIHAAPRGHPPFICQAVIEEQDTNLLLGEQTTVTEPREPAWYLANILEREEACPLGSVMIQGQKPTRLLAVVHDIERTPTCEPDTIQQAWLNVMQAIVQKQITSVAMPLLGTVHGKLSINDSVTLLRECLQKNVPPCLERIWLILPEGCDYKSLTKLNVSN